jgi:hypothetical protein
MDFLSSITGGINPLAPAKPTAAPPPAPINRQMTPLDPYNRPGMTVPP